MKKRTQKGDITYKRSIKRDLCAHMCCMDRAKKPENYSTYAS